MRIYKKTPTKSPLIFIQYPQKPLKNIVKCAIIPNRIKENSSGQGVNPYRRYSPRPM